MNITFPFPEIAEEKSGGLGSQQHPAEPIAAKNEQQTAAKPSAIKLDESQNGRIRNFIFSLFKQERLRGHFKVENFDSLEVIEVILFHKINQYVNYHPLRAFKKPCASPSPSTTHRNLPKCSSIPATSRSISRNMSSPPFWPFISY